MDTNRRAMKPARWVVGIVTVLALAIVGYFVFDTPKSERVQTRSASDGGTIEIGDSVASVSHHGPTDPSGDENLYVGTAVYFQNTSEVDAASATILVTWIAADGSVITSPGHDGEYPGLMLTGTLIPGETGASTVMAHLAEEPVDVQVTVDYAVWERYSEKLHSQCTISYVDVNSRRGAVEAGFVIEFDRPSRIDRVVVVVTLFDGEDLVGVVGARHDDMIHLEPGRYDVELAIDDWTIDDYEQMTPVAHCNDIDHKLMLTPN